MTSKAFRAFLACLILCISPAARISAQLEGFLDSAPTATAEKSPEEIRAQLDKWQTEAKTQLDRLSTTPGPEEGMDSPELSTLRRYLEQILLGITRHRSNLDGITAAKEELQTAKAASENWSGFDTQPPYSILMVDELINRRESVAEKAASHQSSIDIFNSNLNILLAEWKAADESAEQALNTYQQAVKNDDTARWKLESSQAKTRSLSIRISSLQCSVIQLENLKQATSFELALLDRKIREAKKKSVFSPEDLEQIRKASSDRQASMRKEIATIRSRQEKAGAEFKRTKENLEKLNSGETPDPAAIELATMKLESADTKIEAMQTMVESYDAYEQLETFVPESYELRYTLVTGKNRADRQTALEGLVGLNKRLEAWEIISKNELSSVAADINKQESQATTIPANDPRLAPLTEQRSILWEKQALIQRANQMITSHRRLLARWISDYEKKEKPPWYSPATSIFSRSGAAVQRAWNIPVTKVTETIEVDGQTVERTRSVSLGVVISAIILFAITYFIAAKISRRFQRILVHRHYIGENQARTLRNWIMLVVALLLALATLSWLSIPLTVFAFLAGALAIGVGFGTQTIIKNFISGIILLFERKVRVGDIVEVDGTLGVVSEINTRSSIVRGFNGIENLIPNALFLENRVVNWTLNSRFLRRELTLGVAYGSPPQKVIDILLEAAERHGLILKDPAPFAIFNNFGDSSLDFTMYYWIELNDKTNSLIVGSDLRIMIEKKLLEAQIEVPFPQRDIRLTSNNPVQVEIINKGEI